MAQARWSLTAGSDLQDIEDLSPATPSSMRSRSLIASLNLRDCARLPTSVEWFQSSIALTSENDLQRVSYCLSLAGQ